MALTPYQTARLKSLYARLDPIEPLQPTDERYVPIYNDRHREDPVERLATRIEWTGVESLGLFSGFRGSGKTTELFRLRKRLEEMGYIVVYANALDYLNPGEPVDIADLVLALVGAFDDGLTQLKVAPPLGESVWSRLTDYLKRTSLAVTEATASMGVDSPAKEVAGGLSAGLVLKVALRETGSFRKRLREFLQNRLGELKAEADRYVEQRIQSIPAFKNGIARVVFIFDQLEQIRGTASNEEEVIRSVERIFGSHLSKLQLPLVHAIYTVPPWLQLMLPGLLQCEILATFQLWENNPNRSRHEEGWTLLRELVCRRLGENGQEEVFGTGMDGQTRVDRLIEASGGHFRDLLILLRELLVRLQTQQQSLPACDETVTEAIQRLREQYLPLSVEDARRLKRIKDTRACNPLDTSAGEAMTVSRLLDLHLVLYFSNGEEWYDVHPLIRGEIERVIQLGGGVA